MEESAPTLSDVEAWQDMHLRKSQNMEYKRAVRENTNVLVALAGASGSGKTYSAMQLATGICGDAPFAMVDTEARRGLHYADQFDFEHVELGPAFTPGRYLDSIQQLATRGFKAIIIDSGSHEWEGEGRGHRAGGRIEQEGAVQLDRAEAPAQAVRERPASVRHESDHLPARG